MNFFAYSRRDKWLWVFLWTVVIYVIFKHCKSVYHMDSPSQWVPLAWKLGDWLISFEGGLVRRGLMGSLILFISNFGFKIQWVTFFFQAFFAILVLHLTQKLYFLRQRNSGWLLIMLSPAFLLFPWYDFQAAFKKEIIFFSFFLMMLYCLAIKKLNQKYMLFFVAAYLFSGLSHEMVCFLLPFYLYVIYKYYETGLLSKKLSFIYSAVFGLCAAAVLFFSTKYRGDINIADSICQSIVSRGFSHDICNGAIIYLKNTPDFGYREVLWLFPHHMPYYLVMFFIVFLPIFLSDWLDKKKALFMFFSIIFFMPLFVVATDWGRWIYILFSMFVFIMLAESVEKDVEFKFHHFPKFVLAAYLSFWALPHQHYSFAVKYGFLAKVIKNINKIQRHL